MGKKATQHHVGTGSGATGDELNNVLRVRVDYYGVAHRDVRDVLLHLRQEEKERLNNCLHFGRIVREDFGAHKAPPPDVAGVAVCDHFSTHDSTRRAKYPSILR